MSVKVITRRYANLCFICLFFFLLKEKTVVMEETELGQRFDDSNNAIIFFQLIHIDSPENYCKFIEAKLIVL